jgi:hypothetical protein
MPVGAKPGRKVQPVPADTVLLQTTKVPGIGGRLGLNGVPGKAERGEKQPRILDLDARLGNPARTHTDADGTVLVEFIAVYAQIFIIVAGVGIGRVAQGAIAQTDPDRGQSTLGFPSAHIAAGEVPTVILQSLVGVAAGIILAAHGAVGFTGTDTGKCSATLEL